MNIIKSWRISYIVTLVLGIIGYFLPWDQRLDSFGRIGESFNGWTVIAQDLNNGFNPVVSYGPSLLFLVWVVTSIFYVMTNFKAKSLIVTALVALVFGVLLESVNLIFLGLVGMPAPPHYSGGGIGIGLIALVCFAQIYLLLTLPQNKNSLPK